MSDDSQRAKNVAGTGAAATGAESSMPRLGKPPATAPVIALRMEALVTWLAEVLSRGRHPGTVWILDDCVGGAGIRLAHVLIGTTGRWLPLASLSQRSWSLELLPPQSAVRRGSSTICQNRCGPTSAIVPTTVLRRTHLGLGKDTPAKRPTKTRPPRLPRSSRFLELAVCTIGTPGGKQRSSRLPVGYGCEQKPLVVLFPVPSP
ncbi:MAG: hypothetical protein V2A73_15470 [Pseudomonadota bacterium]